MGMQFNEENNNQSIYPSSNRTKRAKGLIPWLIQKGIVKNETQATIFAFVFIGCMIALSVFLLNEPPPNLTLPPDPPELK